MLRFLVVVVAIALVAGCVSRPEPGPANQRVTPPPWDAPRDAISYIRSAGQPELGLGEDADPWIVRVKVSVDGAQVQIPAHIGVDRLRAVQAPVHTHEPGGEVWLEGTGNRQVNLGHFFTLWGVRFGDGCLGARCGELAVIADGGAVAGDPRALRLRGVKEIVVSIT